MERKKENLSDLLSLTNTLFEEKNYIEILKGFCENCLETSDDMNKIYPIIQIIYNLHEKNYCQAKNINVTL